ncbi:hypothetical protein EGW08_010410, partial [Elysia chlorotica]
ETNLTTEAPALHRDTSGETVGVLMIVVRPAICALGLVTNSLSLLVFLQPSMRNLSCSVYLAVKAVSDFAFLLSSLVLWLTSVQVRAFHTEGVCQLVLFATYLAAFISIWLVVALTIENLLCVVRPWFVQRSCNARTARILTSVIVVLGIGLYHFALWNNGLRTHTRLTGPTACQPLEEFTHLAVALTYVDSLMTLLLPLIVLTVSNAAIIVLALRASRRQRRRDMLIRFLFSVSMTLLLFHLPSHLLRLKYLLLSASALDVLLFRWFETLYISHYAIGFFVYIAFGSNFRKVF